MLIVLADVMIIMDEVLRNSILKELKKRVILSYTKGLSNGKPLGTFKKLGNRDDSSPLTK